LLRPVHRARSAGALIARDFLCLQCTLINGTTQRHGVQRREQNLPIAWFGGTYALLPTLDLTTAYYHEWQNEFLERGQECRRGNMRPRDDRPRFVCRHAGCRFRCARG
jgi:hypothetical protein